MKYTKYILCVLFSLLMTFNIFSQGTKQEKIEALRVAFISQKINLSADESQKFWPIYNEYQDKLKAARQELKNRPNTFSTDKEAQDYLDAELLLKQRELNLNKEYFEKMKRVISVKKVALLRLAEEDFKKELLKQLQNKSTD